MLFLIGPLFYSLAIISNTRLIYFIKTLQIRDQFILYTDPGGERNISAALWGDRPPLPNTHLEGEGAQS
jgi:hypothetical protein